MRRFSAAVWLCLAVAASLALAPRPATPALAQHGRQHDLHSRVSIAEAVVASGTAMPALAAGLAATRQTYIPLAVVPPRISVQFATRRDATGNLVDPGTVFAYGTTTLYANVTVGGARGRSYRHEWYINGALQPQLTYGPVQVPFDVTLYRVEIFTTQRPLDRGTYQINTYLGGALYATATATIK
jgi:hypothetical protein